MKLLDLFCGAGGLSHGFESAGFDIALGVDINAAALETFLRNHCNAQTLCGDLTDDMLKQQIIEASKQNQVRGILGGPPCQGFSLKGKKLGLQDERNFLFREYLKLVAAIQPDFIVMENVKALVSTANGYFLKEITQELENLGLTVRLKILNAREFGVPQNRERVFIVGMKKQTFDFSRLPTGNRVTVADAISDLHFLASGEGAFEQDYKLPENSAYQCEMRQNSRKLFNHQATNHNQIALTKLKMIPPEGDKSSLPLELRGKQQFVTTWARLKWQEVSPTIDTRFDTPSNGCNSHPELHRSITPREAARLQSFPDDFVFYGKKTDICKQIGNAVPPKLAFALACALKQYYFNDFI
ncbi:DNA cytosine methyltransferase [Conchiformibius kuhniae]|uniref:DNA (cytosine-5-)-methyltransferase n=1 Tax=Conchiformibius kuhniae TaxID=211502 RepID=A0A8T9MTM0_9NEIS|nr:DNA cytosine methyltransferase [Conchiformibius kuhniae]UOP04165.1 DNA cytosine methyltransferase [Conchiformibius kuhniae]